MVEIVSDAAPPDIGAFALSNQRFSAQPNFNTVVVPLRIDGGATAVSVSVGTTVQFPDAGATRAVFTIDSTFSEGPTAVTVNATDVAGNAAMRSETIFIDLTPPDFLGAPILEVLPPLGAR